MTLLGPSGRPISEYKKAAPPKLGPAFGDWAGRDTTWNTMPGGAILGFDLSRLTVEDFRMMRNHPQISISLTLLTFMIHQIEWHIEAEQEKVRIMVEDNLREVWSRLVRALSQAYWAGYSPIVPEYENAFNPPRVVINKFKDLRPEDTEVHWKTVEGYAPPNMVPPKFKIYDGITDRRWSGTERIRKGRIDGDASGTSFDNRYHIPAEQTLWYPLLMENGDYYGRKLLKPAFAPWYFSVLIHLFANRYYERFGEPIPIGRYPSDSDVQMPDGEMVTGRSLMELVVNSLRNRTAVLLPSDQMPTGLNTTEPEYQLEYLESQMRGADFERYLTRLDEEISLSLFTPILMVRTGDVGSHNLGVQHTQTWLWMLNALAGDMKEYIDRYVCRRLRDYNFGTNAGRVEWKPRAMGKENVEILRTIIAALLEADKVALDVGELGEMLGMTVKELSEVTQAPEGEEADTDPAGNDDRARRSGPRGTGEPRATGREVSARIGSQVKSAWRKGTFGPGFKPDLGFRRRFEASLMAEGCSAEDATRLAGQVYDRAARWLEDVAALGTGEFRGPEDFMSVFDRMLDNEIEDLARAK